LTALAQGGIIGDAGDAVGIGCVGVGQVVNLVKAAGAGVVTLSLQGVDVATDVVSEAFVEAVGVGSGGEAAEVRWSKKDAGLA